jgi:MSHA biogenesis protein MshM
MPYVAHFGLREHPFILTPNTDLYYPCRSHIEILKSVGFALARQAGIIKVVGDIGTGKTMLTRLLMRLLKEDGQSYAFINAPRNDANGMITMVCHAFGVDTEGHDDPYIALANFLMEEHELGKNCVLVVDEAQALGASGLEAIRLMSNLETKRNKLLQIVLFGQQELDELLATHGLRQLNQRIAFSFSTQPLVADEVAYYIRHRIAKSRAPGVRFEIFRDEAITLIARYAKGTPRLINILADKAMLSAFAEGAYEVKLKHAEEAIEDSANLVHRLPFYRRRSGRRMLWVAIASEVAAAAALALWVWSSGASPDIGWRRADAGEALGAMNAMVTPFPRQVGPGKE